MPEKPGSPLPNGPLAWMRIIGDFIRDIGFPVFVAVWLLWQVAPAITENTIAQQRVAHHLEELVKQQRELIVELRRQP